VSVLGRFPLPVEVVDFGADSTRRLVEKAMAAAGCNGQIATRRDRDGHAFVTDQGHLILDLHLGRIPDPAALSRALLDVPGVVEHGLFLGLAGRAILAGKDGIRVLERDFRG